MWRPQRQPQEWEAADLRFVRESDRGGRWEPRDRSSPPPAEWELSHGAGRFLVRPTPFKHVGLFPEQSANWAFTRERIGELSGELAAREDRRPRLLNLFAYTGAATVMASLSGAFVTHVDASKPALRWAKDNAARSGLKPDAVRWILDDALAFVRREQRRGQRYDGILLDPPPYGRGPDGQRWTFEDGVLDLLSDCRQLLSEGPAFVLLSCYAVGTTPLAFLQMLQDLGDGQVESGELAIPQEGSTRLLPAGLCARWWRSR